LGAVVAACARTVARCREVWRGAGETWWRFWWNVRQCGGGVACVMVLGEYCCGDLSLNGLVEREVRKMVSEEVVEVQGGTLHRLKVAKAFVG